MKQALAALATASLVGALVYLIATFVYWDWWWMPVARPEDRGLFAFLVVLITGGIRAVIWLEATERERLETREQQRLEAIEKGKSCPSA